MSRAPDIRGRVLRRAVVVARRDDDRVLSGCASATSTCRVTSRSRRSTSQPAPSPLSRRVSTASAGRFPNVREPLWDGDAILFALEDQGNVHIRRVPASGGDSGARRRRRSVGERLRCRRRHDRPRDVDADHAERDLRGRPPADRGERCVLRGHEAAAVGAVRRDRAGRLRGRGVARPSARLRRGHELPGAAQHPRRPVHAVREQVLRRVPGLRARRLRRPLLEPARLVRVLGGVGPGDPRAGRRRWRLGLGRLHRPDGGRRRGARAVRLPRRRPHGRHRAARTAAT